MQKEIYDYLKKNLNISFNENKKIIIFGDSHSKCFCREDIIIDNLTILNKYKSGASLKGLSKEDSTLNYKKYIYENIDKKSFIILKFGQVDMEFGYYYTNIIKKIYISIEDYIKNLIDIYNIFLSDIVKENPNIIVFGINLCNPFPEWKNYIKNVIKMDKNEKNDIIDKLTYNNHNNNLLKFNNSLKKLCFNLEIKYIDSTKIISNVKDNIYIIKKKYIGKDIHLKGAELSKYLDYKEDNLYGANTYLIFLQLIINNI